MNEETVKLKENKNWPKKLIIAITVTALIIGGSVAAYVYINATPKNKYFHAESESLSFMKNTFKEQYEPETNWRESTKNKPVRSNFELSANFNDHSSGFDMLNPMALINFATLSFTTEKDIKSKEISAALNASLGDVDIGDLSFYATDEKLLLDLPFLNESLILNDDDIGSFVNKIEPKVDANQEFDLNILFEGTSKLITDEQKEHIEKEYFDMIYDELDDDFFTSSEETVDVNGESFKADKITLDLSENELKDLVEKFINKMSKDHVVKDMVQDILIQQADIGMSFIPTSPEVMEEIDMVMNNYEQTLQDIINEINFMYFKDGITSTLWIHKGLIVKRLFEIEFGEDETNFVELIVDGTQTLHKDEQIFNYDLTVSDQKSSETVNLDASFINEDGQSTDSITLSIDDFNVTYNSEESLVKNDRKFDRTLAFGDDINNILQLTWTGNAAYDRDKMNSDHQFSLDIANIMDGDFALQLDKESAIIKEVESPSKDSSKDLGAMNDQELSQYIDYEIPEQFQQWLLGKLGGLNFFE